MRRQSLHQFLTLLAASSLLVAGCGGGGGGESGGKGGSDPLVLLDVSVGTSTASP